MTKLVVPASRTIRDYGRLGVHGALPVLTPYARQRTATLNLRMHWSIDSAVPDNQDPGLVHPSQRKAILMDEQARR